MKLRALAIVLCVGLLGVEIASAQPGGNSQTDEIRQHIALLEAKLDTIEQGGRGNERVTDLGGRGRLRMGEPQVIVRIYDLSDLFAVAPTYTAKYRSDLVSGEVPLFPGALGAANAKHSSSGGFGGGGFFSVGRPTQFPAAEQQVLGQYSGGVGSIDSSRASLDTLIEAITATISPESWDEVGGPGSFAKLGNSLLISADRDTHEQIEALFTLFRKRWGTLRTISVRANWLWLRDDQLARLLPADQQPREAADRTGYGLIADDAWQALIKQIDAGGADQKAGYRAAITCYNGQTVHTLSGGQNLAVTQVKTEIGEAAEEAPGAVAYQPVVSVIQEGAALQVTPVANQSGMYVVLDIHSLVSTQQDPVEKKAAAGKVDNPAVAALQAVISAIDRPRLMTHRLSTTLRLPVDQTMLVGGMTFDAVPKPGGQHLYLFAKVSVQELRDDVPSRGSDVEKDAVPEPKQEPAEEE
jgi:hypothetical protein